MKTNTFVIPHLVRPELIERCVDSIWKFTPENFKIIVIDQNALEDILDRMKGKVHLYIKAYRHLGFSKAMNTGIRLIDTDYITILNDDVEFIDNRWWQGVMDQFEVMPKAGAVNPSAPYNNLNGENSVNPVVAEYLDSAEPTQFSQKAYEALTGDKAPEIYGRLMGEGVLDGICTFCTVIPKKVMDEIGLLDEKFYPGSGEDYDFNARCFIRGYRVIGTERAWVWHWWLSTKKELGKLDEKLWLHAPRWNNLNEKWGGKFNLYGHDLTVKDIPPTTIVEL